MAIDLGQPLCRPQQRTRRRDVTAVAPERLSAAKYAYTTRYVAAQVAREPHGYFLANAPDTRPDPGDVMLAEVTRLGQHPRLESPASRRAQMYVGDEIVVAYGHRYAPDQFEAEVPHSLEPAHLVAAGGVVGLVTATMGGLAKPTEVRPLGLLHDSRGRVSLASVAPYAPRSLKDPATLGPRSPRPPVLAVVGTSMNSGKSTALASLVRGLTRAGLRVAAGKATGTGAGGDPGMFRDAGAQAVLDFTDFGHVSTYRLRHEGVVAVFASLVNELATAGFDAVLVEIADGLFQGETARLLADPIFAELVDQVVFAAGEALSATSGVAELQKYGIPVAAVTGRLTSSPLALREADAMLDLPVLGTQDLTAPERALGLLPSFDSAA
jgi:hypothetical protein